MPIVGDVISGPFLLIAGVVVGLIVLGIALVSETIVLLLLRWGSLGRSLRDALIVNLASGLVGLTLAVVIGVSPAAGLGWLGWPALAGAWALSIAIEGALLGWLSGPPRRRAWVAALAMNTASYLLIAGLVGALNAAA